MSAGLASSDRVPRRTQAQRKAESDGRIICAATELFAEQGYVRTTLNQIGSRAGFTGGLVSNRFGSKEGLLRSVLDDIYRSHTRETMTNFTASSSVTERLAIYVKVFLNRVTEPKGQVRALSVVMGEAAGAVPEIRSVIADFTDHTISALAGLIREGVERAEFRPDLEPRRAATLLLGLLRGLTLQHLTRPQSLEIDELLPEIDALLGAWRRGS